MPGVDGFVPVPTPATPGAWIDNEQVGTHLGLPLERQRVSSFEATGLVPLVYDALVLAYNVDGTIATVVYKASGVTVATLALGYTAGALTSVART